MIKCLKLILFLCFITTYNSQTTNNNSPQELFIQSIRNTGEHKTISLGKTIYQGIFTGNGLLGTMTYLKDASSCKITIGRTDVYDHRNGGDNLFERPRLPLGYFEVKLSDNITDAVGKIDLYNAESSAELKTNSGSIQIKAITFSEEDYILLQIDDQNYKNKYEIIWVPEKSESPRRNFSYAKQPENYLPNPTARITNHNSIITSYQPMLAGGGYSVAYTERRLNNLKYILIATDYQINNKEAEANAKKRLAAFEWGKLFSKIKNHQSWWHQYYSKSSFNISDQELQDFYNYQLYKLASATRSNKPAIDLQGPWTDKTPWPGYWYNLNMQLTYSPLYTANHLELAESLIKAIDKNYNNLIKNVPNEYQYNSIALGRSAGPDMYAPVKVVKGSNASITNSEAETGNLTWLLYYYYQHYDVTRDEVLGNKVFNLLKKSINYYIHLLGKNKEGKYQLEAKTYSPEYSKGYAFNTNYDLSILRWGLKTLIEMDSKKGRKDELYPQWQDILQNLIPFPTNEGGYMIAQDVPYSESHRHYSHLLMIYPFYEINWDQTENHNIIEKSINTWQSKPEALQGYSLTGHASMRAMMGQGNESRDIMKTFIQKFVKPNTLYAESGPVIETPLAGMQSIQELYLQHWNGVTRIFPAAPEDWKEISFKNLRTSGAFLISAVRKNGKNTEVSIYSEKGGQIKIKPNFEGAFTTSGSDNLIQQNNSVYIYKIPKGKTLTLKAN
ncbi:hypothetical protein M2T92_06070 [Elizabethkingia miricola]|uniref:glycosyl hydrolase family 95 catalytic domain-containing protein n=1 Tax=Elizabethkingia miricola TaxID=172045 RepID=UPI0020129033|nr:hypothetical protein [Elizabethkingia miricola]MCL1678581.1 hypothetical protein [Elizabethkingia miricola]